jgi:hypothetical protein
MDTSNRSDHGLGDNSYAHSVVSSDEDAEGGDLDDLPELHSELAEKIREEDSNVMALQRLLSHALFRHLLLAITSVYFAAAGLQFWTCSYLAIVLNSSPLLVNGLFILCSATAPTSGAYFGAWLIDDIFGGYKGNTKSKAALGVCCVLGKWVSRLIDYDMLNGL